MFTGRVNNLSEDIDCIICGKTVMEIQSDFSNTPLTIIHFEEVVCEECYNKKGAKK